MTLKSFRVRTIAICRDAVVTSKASRGTRSGNVCANIADPS